MRATSGPWRIPRRTAPAGRSRAGRASLRYRGCTPRAGVRCAPRRCGCSRPAPRGIRGGPHRGRGPCRRTARPRRGTGRPRAAPPPRRRSAGPRRGSSGAASRRRRRDPHRPGRCASRTGGARPSGCGRRRPGWRSHAGPASPPGLRSVARGLRRCGRTGPEAARPRPDRRRAATAPPRSPGARWCRQVRTS